MMSLGFCALVSAVVGIFAVPLLSIFIDPSQGDVMAVGVHYLRTEGLCYVGIGLLFLLYATYRGLERAGMSIVLTVISLGLRVALAYWLAPSWGLDGMVVHFQRGGGGGCDRSDGLKTFHGIAKNPLKTGRSGKQRAQAFHFTP